ncbi:glycosyltransferase family 4 protein [Cupriavidus sp. PET2-C1]
METINGLVLTRYGRMGASSRMRFMQFASRLESAGVVCSTQAFLDDDSLMARYRGGRYQRSHLIQSYWARIKQLVRRQSFDLLWIEKEALPWFPASLERALLRGVPYVLDYDDALFHNYDLHRSSLVRCMLGRRIDRLMAGASLVVAGNEYLAQRARDAGAPWVEIVPTVVDLERYDLTARSYEEGQVPRIVWIGSPSTARYLSTLEAPLQELARSFAFKLRVIGADVDLPGVDVECVPWTEATEVASIAQCDIGIMPLVDSPWEHGKCGYKLIQYMACGLPVVASPIGVNTQIVRDGENGFLADGAQAWVARLSQLLEDLAMRTAMGREGRRRVEAEYCVQQVAPRLAKLLQKVGAR